MANTYKNIVITPNRDTAANVVPVIRFSGGDITNNTDINVKVYTTQNGTLSFEGSAGQLFSITNDLNNVIFSVNDVSGIPSLEIDANGTITMAEFGGNVGIGTGRPNANLHLMSSGPVQFRMTSSSAPDNQRIIFGNPIDTGFGEIYPGGASLFHSGNTLTIASYSTTSAKVDSFTFYNPDGTIHYATINSTGLGVGFFKTSPAYELDVGGTTSTETLLVNGIDMDVKTTAAFAKANTVNVRSTTPLNIYVGTTAPTGNSVGDIWIDTN